LYVCKIVYVCMYVCIYTFIYLCIYVDVFAYVCIYAHPVVRPSAGRVKDPRIRPGCWCSWEGRGGGGSGLIGMRGKGNRGVNRGADNGE
ncbi:hypothetical protein B484DRAFT_330600, partial [Ochromonadaceae sp. CCMP2298]